MLVIQRRDTSTWQLPGGVLKLDEMIIDGVRREVLEETRVRVEPERLTGVYKGIQLRCVLDGDDDWITGDDLEQDAIHAYLHTASTPHVRACLARLEVQIGVTPPAPILGRPESFVAVREPFYWQVGGRVVQALGRRARLLP